MKFKHRLTAALGAAFAGLALAATPALAYTEYDVLNMAGHGTITPSYLVVHSTANPGATAKNHVDYWTRMGNNSTMAHWVIDWTGDGTVYQMAASNVKVYHVGNGNAYSVGIEICEATNATDFAKVYDEAAKWCADFLKSRGWGVDRMISHNDARIKWGGTDHTDPLPYFTRFGKSWDDFKALVNSYLMGASTSTPSASASSTSTSTASGATKIGYNLPGGRYRVNVSALNVRAGHTTSSAVVATYRRGQTVILDSTYYIQDGYVWGTYIGYSGARRYVAVGKATGKVESSDYLLRY